MRWKISNVETSNSIDKENGLKINTKTETKQLMLTIGDAVGVGKNAASAVVAAAKSIPALAKSFPDAGLEPFSTSIGVLATLVTGLDVYKKVMRAVEKATPMVQMVARLSGIWCSPGNAGDIAQIVLGQVQKILIQLAISSIIKLKDWVWNYEFSIKEIKNVYITKININISNLSKKLEGVIKESIVQETDPPNIKDNIFGNDGNGSFNISDMATDSDINNSNVFGYKFSDAYLTKYNGRLLRGSLEDKGIDYSDDNGITWNKSSMKIGSWGSFAKIFNEQKNKIIYVSGGVDLTKTIKPTEDKKILINKNYFYTNKDYNTIEEYTLSEKNKLKVDKAYDQNLYKDSMGVYYSEDNGETWSKTELISTNEWVNDLCEFERDEISDKPTIVLSSNDYHGAYITYDGINWSESDVKTGKWLSVTECNVNKKYIFFKEYYLKPEQNNYNFLSSTSKIIESNNITSHFKVETGGIEKIWKK